MRAVAIVGVGLIGGSFALALRKAGFAGRIMGVSSPATLQDALARGVVDEGVALDRAAEEADLVFLAQPILRILDTLDALGASLKADALATDAGSTKVEIDARARARLRAGQFLGGHPMAGKETRGAAAADADLFRGRTWILTPRHPAEMETPLARNLLDWIRRVGADPLVLSPEDHDRIVAYTSHLPQLLSTALASTLADVPDAEQAAGPAAMDLTRLALSPFDVWRDIFTTNAAPIDEALRAYIGILEGLRRNLSSPALRDRFDQAAEQARRLREGR